MTDLKNWSDQAMRDPSICPFCGCTGLVATFRVMVRTNCEYSLLLDVGGNNEDEAHAIALVKANSIPLENWQQSWADADAETVSLECRGGVVYREPRLPPENGIYCLCQ